MIENHEATWILLQYWFNYHCHESRNEASRSGRNLQSKLTVFQNSVEWLPKLTEVFWASGIMSIFFFSVSEKIWVCTYDTLSWPKWQESIQYL